MYIIIILLIFLFYHSLCVNLRIMYNYFLINHIDPRLKLNFKMHNSSKNVQQIATAK